MNLVNYVREKNPLIHHLTNEVVTNFTANGLLAFGGSPIMAKEQDEIKEITSISDGVLLNIGTLRKDYMKSMLLAGQVANEKNIPVVLDPVGIAISKMRQQFIENVLNNIKVTAIKGNAGEMAFLAGETWETKGVDSTDGNIKELRNFAKIVSKRYSTIAIVTGKVDVIAYKDNIMLNETGHEYLTKVTGSGCLLGSIITASLAVESINIETVHESVSFYGRAADLAVKQKLVNGPGTFLPHFIDALSKGEEDEYQLFT